MKLLNKTLVILMLLVSTAALAQVDSTQGEPEVKEDVIIDTKGVRVVVKEKTSEMTTNENGDTVRTKTETIEITTSREEDPNTEEDVASDNELNLKEIIKKELKQEVEKVDEPKFIETDWNNFHLGFNNLINADGQLDVAEGYDDIEVASSSVNFSWDIVTQAMNLYKGKIRLIYGVGIDYNNYRFKNDITLGQNTDELEIMVDDVNYDKNKLVTQHLTVPVLLNFKVAPKGSDDFVYISGGANFGYRIGSHMKQKWNDNGKKKNKIEDDYNLEQFRLGYEMQIGYKNVVLFGRYFPQSIFKADEGPELRTVSAGILIGKI